MRIGVASFLVVVVASCGTPSGPPTTDTSSASLPTLAERVEFLQRYVKFRRNYHELDFRIVYQNNGDGLVPGPSDWDIRIIAAVPAEELESWVPADSRATPAGDATWLSDVPGSGRATGVKEWYTKGAVVVGLDRASSVVVYRSWAR